MKYLFYLVFSVLFVSCGSATVTEQPVTEQPVTVQAVPEQAVPEQASAQPQEETSTDLSDVFYFDFDKSDIQPQFYPVLDAYADLLHDRIASDPDLIIIIEGHCDERGTDEYNIALGQRRADAVGRYLRVQGIPAVNIDTVSYGKLFPASLESNQEAWALNRRATLSYY